MGAPPLIQRGILSLTKQKGHYVPCYTFWIWAGADDGPLSAKQTYASPTRDLSEWSIKISWVYVVLLGLTTVNSLWEQTFGDKMDISVNRVQRTCQGRKENVMNEYDTRANRDEVGQTKNLSSSTSPWTNLRSREECRQQRPPQVAKFRCKIHSEVQFQTAEKRFLTFDLAHAPSKMQHLLASAIFPGGGGHVLQTKFSKGEGAGVRGWGSLF